MDPVKLLEIVEAASRYIAHAGSNQVMKGMAILKLLLSINSMKP